MPVRSVLRYAFAVIVVAVVTYFVTSTFRPEARYHFPSDRGAARLHCVFEAIYLADTDAEVLVFGTSRTGASFNPPLLGKELSERSGGHPVNVFNLSTAGANPGLSYQYLQEYVSNHRPPRLIIFEVEQVRDSPSVVPYVNRYFSMTASPDLYFDTLLTLNWPSAINRLADVSRLFIDHLDRSLTKILSPWQALKLNPSKLACHDGKNLPDADWLALTTPLSVREMAVRLLGSLLIIGEESRAGSSRVGIVGVDNAENRSKSEAANQKSGALDAEMAKRRNRAEREKAKIWEARESTWEALPAWDWGYTSPKGNRYLHYYRNFVDWAARNDARIVFVRLPGYLEPPSTLEQIAEFEALVGAPVVVLDTPILRKLYPDYRDVNHMGAVSRPLMMGWLADQLAERMALREVFAEQAATASQ